MTPTYLDDHWDNQEECIYCGKPLPFPAKMCALQPICERCENRNSGFYVVLVLILVVIGAQMIRAFLKWNWPWR